MRIVAFLLITFYGVQAFCTASGLPIPRFVSLRSSEVNLRVGPGHHFPTDWVYQRTHLPLEVIAEFGDWRKVRDLDATQGWIHKSLLSGRRHVLVMTDRAALRVSDNTQARVVAYLQTGVIASLKKTDGDWCYIELRQTPSYKGWIQKRFLWGLGPKD